MMIATTTLEDEVIEMIRRLPDDVTLEEIEYSIFPADVTFDEIEYHVSAMAAFERGVRDVEAGRCVTQEEAEERLLGCRCE
jgi:predicted transcriptional regulator